MVRNLKTTKEEYLQKLQYLIFQNELEWNNQGIFCKTGILKWKNKTVIWLSSHLCEIKELTYILLSSCDTVVWTYLCSQWRIILNHQTLVRFHFSSSRQILIYWMNGDDILYVELFHSCWREKYKKILVTILGWSYKEPLLLFWTNSKENTAKSVIKVG